MAGSTKGFSENPLNRSELVGRLAEEFQEKLWELATPVSLKKGQTLFVQDDPSDALYVVESGNIEISIFSSSGKKLAVNIMKAPDVFGEIGALDGGPRTATATAKDNAKLYQIKRSRMLELMTANPDFSMEMFRILCERIRWISQHVEDLALTGLESRLARRLLILEERYHDEEGRILLSQFQLAEFLGTTRETINKLLQQWQAQGLIKVLRSKLVIMNRNAIRELAN